MSKTIPGINIQWPWSELIVNGIKTIETRTYAIPEKYKGVELAIIETPGPRGKKMGIDKARIIGTVVFSSAKQYKTEISWKKDKVKHCVEQDDIQYKFDPYKNKWGWVIGKVRKFKIQKPAPKKRGIVFALKCEI